MKDSNKVKKSFRVIGTTLSLFSVPLLSSLVLLNPAHAEGDDIVCNQSKTTINVVLRAQNDSGQRSEYGRGTVRAKACKTIFWDGATGLDGNVTEWIQVSNSRGPFSPGRYVAGVDQSRTAGAWMLMRTGRITVR